MKNHENKQANLQSQHKTISLQAYFKLFQFDAPQIVIQGLCKTIL